MKKLILFLITITTLTNVSYASFPVTETEQTEVVEYDSINSLPVSFIGVLVGILSSIIFPWNLLLLRFIKDRSFRKSFIIGTIIGFILFLIFFLPTIIWWMKVLFVQGLMHIFGAD